ncbi:MAG: hypothetical protein AB1806_16300 [Acidobacteriota bacterium]
MARGDATTDAQSATAPDTGGRRATSGFTTRARRTLGVTLLELTVTLTVAVTAALLVVPSLSDLVTRYRMQRALGDCQTLATAVADFHRDNGVLPTYEPGVDSEVDPKQPRPVRVLVTEGTRPDEPINPDAWLSGGVDQVRNHLSNNEPGYPAPTSVSATGWRGPYLRATVGPDPWGRQYLVNVGAPRVLSKSLMGERRSAATWGVVWVLSAGPNGVIETAFEQSSRSPKLGGDDIGVRVQ